jgi:hypothetical protein
MKTLRQLMNSTDIEVRQRSKNTTATVISAKKERKKDLNALVLTIRCKAITEKIFYDVIIELYPNEIHKDVYSRPSLDMLAWVQCSCPYWLFNLEYAVAKVGSTEIKFSNGKPPVITNPKLKIGLCKHLYKAADESVLKQAKKLMSGLKVE